MHKELKLVEEFHRKFQVPVLDVPSASDLNRITFRQELMSEEVNEYKKDAGSGDIVQIAKELADVLYATYGTILEHGLQDKMEEIFMEVHRSNMSKEYAPYKVAKGKEYRGADIKSILDK